MKNISRFHHITQSDLSVSPLEQIEQVCQGGGDWSQLRLKDISTEKYINFAKEAKNITQFYNAKLIINDNIEVAKAVQADGVHLGKKDVSTKIARNLLGSDIIIGRTCNTLEDVLFYHQEEIDYIGLGPFKFTDTKKVLSPVLGLDGYKEIISALSQNHLPIIAIGGIQITDIQGLIIVGVYGIALASEINRAKNIAECVNRLQTL